MMAATLGSAKFRQARTGARNGRCSKKNQSEGELLAQARVVYCQTLRSRKFALGLELLVRTGACIMR